MPRNLLAFDPDVLKWLPMLCYKTNGNDTAKDGSVSQAVLMLLIDMQARAFSGFSVAYIS